MAARFGDGPENARADAGEAYVIFGAPGPPGDADLANGEQDLTVWGAAPGDNLGFEAAAADVNDDGIDDILLTALFAAAPNDSRAGVGAVYVMFGSKRLGGLVDLAKDSPDVILVGDGSGSLFGDSLATGDVNGDGITDVMVGATFQAHSSGAEPAPVSGGATYLLHGRRDWPSILEMANKEYDAAIFGAGDFDELGDTVASGDINGDGLDDIIVTAEAADGPNDTRPVAAEVYAVFGSPQLSGDLEVSSGDQDLTILGADSQDTLGFDLASGDLNGDGIDDLVMAARLDDGPSNALNRVGALYILFGNKELPGQIDLAQQPETIATLYGVDAADTMGNLAIGDTQLDGKNELLVGIAFGDGPGNSRFDGGEVYVLDASGAAGLASLADHRPLIAVFGAQAEERLGSAMAVADINGDARPELLIMAADANGPQGSRAGAGRVYILSLDQ